MKEITKVIYVADDGKEFATKPECFEYESECKKIKSFKRTLNAIADFCFKHPDCRDCPFYNKTDEICDITFSSVGNGGENLPYNWKF
jgi:hypothetical protein